MKLFLPIFVLFLFANLQTCSSKNASIKDDAVNYFLFNHFEKRLNHASKIVTITKNSFFSLLLETADTSEALNDMKTFWPFNYENYYDTIYFSDSKNSLTAFVRFFGGDTTWYTTGYLKNSLRDSSWTIKRPTYMQIESYKNGKSNGNHIGWYPNGQIAYKKKWKMNQIVDTVFNWYPNGIIQEFEVWEKGESIFHKCFNNKGEPIECEGD